MLESNMSIAFAKLFLASHLVHKERPQKAIEVLDKVIEEFIAHHDGCASHPDLERFYKTLATICLDQKMAKKGYETLEKVYHCVRDLYGENSKDVLGSLIQLQGKSYELGKYQDCLEMGKTALEVLTSRLDDLNQQLQN